MKWLIWLVVFLGLTNIALAVLTWVDLSTINDNLFLVYGQCVPGQDT